MVSFDRILPELYVGALPEGSDDVEALRDCGVSAVLSLQSDVDLRVRKLTWESQESTYRRFGLEAQRAPMRDFDPENQRLTLPGAVRVLSRLLAAGHTVYLHCSAGVGRSPLVAMAYLYWCRRFGLKEAIEHVRERRPCTPNVELLEDSRRDLLRGEKVEERITRRAERISKQRRLPADCDSIRYEAQCQVLQEMLT